MLSRAKGRTRIDLNQELVLMLLRNLLPGWLDQDIVYGKRFKILLPVINPVLILRLAFGDGALS